MEVERGRAWGAMVFRSNYSNALVERTEQGRSADDYTIEASDIGIRLDMSSKFLLCLYNNNINRNKIFQLNHCEYFQINKLANFCTVIFS